MASKILDFHFTKSTSAFRLEVFEPESSASLLAIDLDFPRSLFGRNEFRRLDLDSSDPRKRVQRLREFGLRLYRQVFITDVEKVWSEQKRASDFLVLRIRIGPDAPELEAIPWETLFDGEDFIVAAGNTTISRLPLAVAPQISIPRVHLPLKMLVFVSSPLDLPDKARLQVEREQEMLLEAINNPAGQGRLRADFEDEATLAVLENAFETPYQIFHFTGHGIPPEDGGGLLLEDADGRSRQTSVSELIRVVRRAGHKLRLAVLSGCQTARTLNVEGFRDVARALLSDGVPSVIAMQFSISDAGALTLAQNLYSKIAAGRSLESALHAARRALLLSDDPRLQADALSAVLLTSNGDSLQTHGIEQDSLADPPKVDFSFFLPLPQLSHGFYGRRREYRQVRDAILRNNTRAVLIHGIGGIGKSAFVSHVALRVRKHFQGVYAFDCSSGTLTTETVLIKLHQYFEGQRIKVLEQLLYKNLPPDVTANYVAQVLSQWSLLLIFDSFESLLERTTDNFQIADESLRTFFKALIKATATRSHFVFVSRYLFEFEEQRSSTVRTVALGDLTRPEALSLMQKLSHLSQATYSEKLQALDTFGGHPYALVTFDRYCAHQPIENALKDAKNIHGTLREFLAIELNYERLSETGRALLNRLAAFRQAVPVEAAEWMLGETVPLPPELLVKIRSELSQKELDDVSLETLLKVLPERRQAKNIAVSLDELIEWGLLTHIQNDESQRLFVHPLVRDFCRDKQSSEVWNHHLRDAAAFYINSTKLLDEKSQAALLDEMEAFELLMEAQEYGRAAEVLVGATELLDRWGFGLYLEKNYERLLDNFEGHSAALILHNLGNLVQSRGDNDKALEYYERALKIEEELGNTGQMAGLLYQIGTTHQYRGDYEKALNDYEQSLKIAEELETPSGVAASLHQIGTIHQNRHDYEQAMEYYRRSLKIREDSGDRSGIARSLHQLGIISQDQGQYGLALDYSKRALSIAEEVNNPLGVARSLHQIGNVYQAQGDYKQALEYYEKSLRIEEELGHRAGLQISLEQIGAVHHRRGALDKALEYYERSLDIAQELGNRQRVAYSHYHIGRVLVDTGLYEAAFDHLLTALTILLEIDAPPTAIQTVIQSLPRLRTKWGSTLFDSAWTARTETDVPSWLTSVEARKEVPKEEELELEQRALIAYQLGLEHVKKGRWYEGLDSFTESLNQLRQGNNLNAQANTIYQIALTHLMLKNLDKARTHLYDALRLYQFTNNEPGMASCNLGLGRLLFSLEYFDQALDHLSRAQHTFESLKDEQALTEVDRLMDLINKIKGLPSYARR